ncbi:unnamed protein product [Cuscuta epithymum]|uniref:Uncharacterized protein n=1 Tax=Cuscuta epithymum TaxID=186058 RepID=A0AAV0CCR7_9ASTE|nr:unnamed protein product [Cuscuta epithymum]
MMGHTEYYLNEFKGNVVIVVIFITKRGSVAFNWKLPKKESVAFKKEWRKYIIGLTCYIQKVTGKQLVLDVRKVRVTEVFLNLLYSRLLSEMCKRNIFGS